MVSRFFRFDVAGMKRTTIFVTGTDTGVGKTVLTALLTRHLRERGVNAAALKPVCSGDRADARALHAASAGALTLDEINPWHFRAPIAPMLAARRERKQVVLADVLLHVRAMQKRFDVLLIEGAGGCSVRSAKNLTRANSSWHCVQRQWSFAQTGLER